MYESNEFLVYRTLAHNFSLLMESKERSILGLQSCREPRGLVSVVPSLPHVRHVRSDVGYLWPRHGVEIRTKCHRIDGESGGLMPYSGGREFSHRGLSVKCEIHWLADSVCSSQSGSLGTWSDVHVTTPTILRPLSQWLQARSRVIHSTLYPRWAVAVLVSIHILLIAHLQRQDFSETAL